MTASRARKAAAVAVSVAVLSPAHGSVAAASSEEVCGPALVRDCVELVMREGENLTVRQQPATSGREVLKIPSATVRQADPTAPSGPLGLVPEVHVCEGIEMPLVWGSEVDALARSLVHRGEVELEVPATCTDVEEVEVMHFIIDYGVASLSMSHNSPVASTGRISVHEAARVEIRDFYVPIYTPTTDYHGVGGHVVWHAVAALYYAEEHVPAASLWCSRVEWVVGKPSATIVAPYPCGSLGEAGEKAQVP
jgi:hypothetical protein